MNDRAVRLRNALDIVQSKLAKNHNIMVDNSVPWKQKRNLLNYDHSLYRAEGRILGELSGELRIRVFSVGY